MYAGKSYKAISSRLTRSSYKKVTFIYQETKIFTVFFIRLYFFYILLIHITGQSLIDFVKSSALPFKVLNEENLE